MTLKSTNKLIGSQSDKGGRKPRKRRDRYDRRGKQSTLAVKAFDSIEEAIGGRDAVVGALAAGDLTEEQRYLFGLIADPRNDARSLGHICAKANYTLGSLLQLFKDAKLARAQIEAIAKVADELPVVAVDTMALAKIREEPCRACEGTGKITSEIKATEDTEAATREDTCGVCIGSGKHTYTPSIERQKLALELGGLYRHASGSGVQMNVFQPPALALGGRITAGYLKDMRAGTDRLLYPGRDAGIDTSEAIDVEVVEGKTPEPTATAERTEQIATDIASTAIKLDETLRTAKSESETNEDVDQAPVPSVDPGTRATRTDQTARSVRSVSGSSGPSGLSGSPFLAPTGVRPKEPA